MPYYFYRQCPENHYPYVIQPGDTLNRISSRLEVSVNRILEANPGINPYNLGIGQTICIPACFPDQTAYIIKPGDTLYEIADAFDVTIASILDANPGIDPNYLRVGQRICIPTALPPDCNTKMAAMQSDINMLRAESSVQQIQDSNYGSSTQKTRVIKITTNQLQFDAVSAVFTGNYTGHYTPCQGYPYFLEAAMGGRRTINVKDDFGVWHSFGFQVPTPQ